MRNILPLQHADYIDSSQIGRFEAIFPNDVPEDRGKPDGKMLIVTDAKYVKLSCEREQAILKVSKRNVSNAIYVAKSVLQVPDNTSILFTSTTQTAYFKYRIKNDLSLALTTYGMLLAVVGLSIEACLGIGKAYQIFYFPPVTIGALTAISFVLKFVGIPLLFYKSLLDAK